jgi:hypothetical protein
VGDGPTNQRTDQPTDRPTQSIIEVLFAPKNQGVLSIKMFTILQKEKKKKKMGMMRKTIRNDGSQTKYVHQDAKSIHQT